MLLFANGVIFLAELGLLFLILAMLRLRGRSGIYLFFAALFGLYLLVVVNAAIFPLYVPAGLQTDSEPFRPNINLIPFRSLCWPGELCLREMIGNVLLTIPFGFGICFLTRLKLRDILWLGPVVGLALEGVQLALSLALRSAFRAVDINDVMLNTLGVWLGYAVFQLIAWLYRALTRRTNPTAGGFFAYLAEVTRNQ